MAEVMKLADIENLDPVYRAKRAASEARWRAQALDAARYYVTHRRPKPVGRPMADALLRVIFGK